MFVLYKDTLIIQLPQFLLYKDTLMQLLSDDFDFDAIPIIMQMPVLRGRVRDTFHGRSHAYADGSPYFFKYFKNYSSDDMWQPTNIKELGVMGLEKAVDVLDTRWDWEQSM
ncbi:hypothetical protein YC2023_089702 [Brassica napus]